MDHVAENLRAALSLLQEARESAIGMNEPNVEIIAPLSEAIGTVKALTVALDDSEPEDDHLAVALIKQNDQGAVMLEDMRRNDPAVKT